MSVSDIKATTLTATGTVKSGRGRLRGIHYVSAATAGSIVVKDGGSGGTTVLNIATPTGTVTDDITIPDRGILCETDIHATLTNITSVTFFWEG